MYIYKCIYVCVYIYTYIYIYTYKYVYIYVCMIIPMPSTWSVECQWWTSNTRANAHAEDTTRPEYLRMLSCALGSRSQVPCAEPLHVAPEPNTHINMNLHIHVHVHVDTCLHVHIHMNIHNLSFVDCFKLCCNADISYDSLFMRQTDHTACVFLCVCALGF